MRYPILLIFFFLPIAGFTQQVPFFSQFREMTGFLNPASVQSDYFIFDTNVSIGANYRKQWASHPLSPRTLSAHADILVEGESNFSLLGGAYFLSDEVGATDFTGYYGRLGALYGNPAEWGLAVGVSLGNMQHTINTNDLGFFEDGDVNEGNIWSESVMDVGAGVYYYRINRNEDVFYAGFSIPQILASKIEFSTQNGDRFAYDRVPHYFVNVGFIKTIESNRLEIFLLGKGVESVRPSADINLRYIGRLEENSSFGFWGGVGMGTSGSMQAEAGGILYGESQLKIGYSLQYFLSSLGPSFGPSHEIILAYAFALY